MKKKYLTLLILTVTIIVSGFTTKNSYDNEDNPIEDCENPFELALGYNAFVRNEVILNGGDTEGPIALGGDLTMEGIITIAAQTAGNNFFNGDNQASSLVVNGRVFYISGEGLHLNNGYAKVGDLSGSSIFDVDPNNAATNTRVTPGGYDEKPRIQVQRNQLEASLNQANVIDFEAAFEVFEETSLNYSLLDANVTLTNDNKITLIQNEVNVLNLTGDVLESLPFITFENTPNQTTPLIINVDAQGDFDWSILNLAGIGDQQGSYIIWNFYNSTTITLTGGSTIVGTLFAPTSYVVKDSSGNINGQVIADSYYHIQGELHHHTFDVCIEQNEEETCPLTVNAGENQEICLGQEITLTAESVGNCPTSTNDTELSYLWSTGETTQSIIVSPEEDTTYSVTITGCEECTPEDEITVIVNDAVADAGEDQNICLGESIILTVEGEGNILWSTGEITPSIIVSPEEDTTYSVTVTNGECEATDEVSVNINETPTVSVTPDDAFVCLLFDVFSTATLTATSDADNYLWSTGETTQSITVSPDQDTTYSVTVTNGECSATAEVTVLAIFCGQGLTESGPLYPSILSKSDTVFMDITTEKSLDQITATFYNLSGRSISKGITKNINQGQNTIGFNLSNISGLSSGVYFVTITDSERVIRTEKIIIR